MKTGGKKREKKEIVGKKTSFTAFSTKNRRDEKYAWKLDNIKKARKAHVNKWLKISTGIGISLGAIVLAIKNIYQKQKK